MFSQGRCCRVTLEGKTASPIITAEVSATMAEKVHKIGVKRAVGYLYYIDKQGDIARAKMARGGRSGGRPEKVEKLGLRKEKGFLYYVDKKGDVARARMAGA